MPSQVKFRDRTVPNTSPNPLKRHRVATAFDPFDCVCAQFDTMNIPMNMYAVKALGRSARGVIRPPHTCRTVRYVFGHGKKNRPVYTSPHKSQCAPRSVSRVSPYCEVADSIYSLVVTKLNGFTMVLSDPPKIVLKYRVQSVKRHGMAQRGIHGMAWHYIPCTPCYSRHPCHPSHPCCVLSPKLHIMPTTAHHWGRHAARLLPGAPPSPLLGTTPGSSRPFCFSAITFETMS